MWNWFSGGNKENLGIDLGAANIKIVELGRAGGRLILRNYAVAKTKSGEEIKIDKLNEKELAEVLKNIMREAGFKSNRASFSLPTGKTFSTVMELPLMPEKELAAAVPFEAQKYVPVPLENVVLDWSVISLGQKAELPQKETSKEEPKNTEEKPPLEINPVKPASPQLAPQNQEITRFRAQFQPPKSGIQVMLVAVPKDIINFLTKAAGLTGLKISAFEHEAFSLARALVGNDSGTYLIADLGPKSADIVIVDQGIVKASHCLEAASKEAALMEIDRVVNLFQMRYNKKVNQCLLVGGRATEKEVREFLASKLRLPLKTGDPFARVQYPQNLEKVLKEELGPPLAVAAGLAMRED